MARFPSRRATWVIIRPMFCATCVLPNPNSMGAPPARRNVSISAERGRSSGSTHAPVCRTALSAGSGHGANVGSAASHGWSVNMWLRTSSTGARPRDAWQALSAAANVALNRSHRAPTACRYPWSSPIRLSWDRRQSGRRVMSRWQNNRGVPGKDVKDARPVCNGRRGHLERRGCDDGVAPFGRRRDRLELVVDERRHHLTLLLRRRRSLVGRSAPGMAHVGTNWRHVEAEADDPVTEVRGDAQSHLRAERVELQPQRDERLNVTARTDCRQQHAHQTLIRGAA